MNRCSVCLMPDTKPGVEFVDGKCPACVRYENRKNINYAARQSFLKSMCDKYRKYDGSYDIIIPVSGGKDSYFQVHTMITEYNMHPLLVAVGDQFTHTRAGTHNFQNIGRAFGLDVISLQLDREFERKMTRAGFEELGSSNWAVDKAIYAWPLQIAVEKKIPLVVYGENVSWEYGGLNAEDTWNAAGQIRNGVVNDKGEQILKRIDPTGLHSNTLKYPSFEELDTIQPIYLSYFYPWNDLVNVETAKKWGWEDLTGWKRQGFIDDYAQIDSIGYLFNYHLKYLKYNLGRVTDIGSRWVRYGTLSKADLEKRMPEDSKLDPQILNDFCAFTGYDKDDCLLICEKWRRKSQ